MDINKEREAFESVFTEAKGWDLTFIMGCYQNIETLRAFAGWQAAKAQAVPEWISVQDRMPEQGQKVLVFRPDAHNHPHKDPNFKICTYAGADIFINSHFEHVITHWKPLESPIEAQEPAND